MTDENNEVLANGEMPVEPQNDMATETPPEAAPEAPAAEETPAA